MLGWENGENPEAGREQAFQKELEEKWASCLSSPEDFQKKREELTRMRERLLEIKQALQEESGEDEDAEPIRQRIRRR